MSEPNKHILYKLETPIRADRTQNSQVGLRNKTWLSNKIWQQAEAELGHTWFFSWVNLVFVSLLRWSLNFWTSQNMLIQQVLWLDWLSDQDMVEML